MTSFKDIINQAKPHTQIGILGGSFDPPHLGHQMMAISFLSLAPISSLWVVPCYGHAEKKNLSAFADRLAMCKLAFRHLDNTKVIDIESHLPAPNYTIETIFYLKSLRPDLRFTIALGSDLVASFPSWHRAEELSLLVEWVIFPRDNHSAITTPRLLEQAYIHKDLSLMDINSTTLRKKLNEKSPICESFIDKKVLEYIKYHHLYS